MTIEQSAQGRLQRGDHFAVSVEISVPRQRAARRRTVAPAVYGRGDARVRPASNWLIPHVFMSRAAPNLMLSWMTGYSEFRTLADYIILSSTENCYQIRAFALQQPGNPTSFKRRQGKTTDAIHVRSAYSCAADFRLFLKVPIQRQYRVQAP